jgi:signal peptide peptidase SppA
MAKTIPLVRLDGMIAASGIAGARALNITVVEPILKAAFSVKGAPAVALVVNSPGGSPAQSSLIARRIRALAEEKKKTVLVFVEDVAASGGYWLACAGDEIFVDESSIIGSIGVISASFGAHEAIARLGIERRVYTAGQSKSQLDPFRPEDAAQVTQWREKLSALHQVFIAHVKARRGAKLRSEPGLFEGEIYLGAQAVALGLVDGIGDVHSVLRARYGKAVRIKPFAPRKPGLLGQLFGQAAQEAAAALEARALWARYGL